ncbi:hypothetical protein [Labedaea rhizosphaerae]|uniref:Uncharacterized protein n=1 Tax=Labedaea rhizosphaerae TaxID=598644 RepID=A0A4R6SI00_LABRH|nr:hypothetical protein [Labedaea rhizosphaerae]TDQ01273.1 hypothetical protein EV186_1021141 [Labedaea rhizosphaerae]
MMTEPNMTKDATAVAIDRLHSAGWTDGALRGILMRSWELAQAVVMDTVIISVDATALAQREDDDGRLLWTKSGPVGEVVEAALALPEPGQPGAPAQPMARSYHEQERDI